MTEQSHVYKCPNHTANLNNMRLNNKWCDVRIRVSGMEIPAHKIILAANLNYFQTMFSSDFFQDSKNGIVFMKSVEGTALEAFVSYAYTGEILLTESNALNFLETANYLGEDGIRIACIEFLESHLKAEDALRAYNFANSIDCLSLKNAAKLRILLNFEKFSQSTDYFDFECENLMDILFDGKTQPVESQEIFLEGIMRWIMHDANNRKIHTKDLLNSIGLTKLTTEYLIKYLGKIACCNDEYGIGKDILFCYHTSIIIQQKQQPVLMIVGNINAKPYFQFYSFYEKKWTPLQTFLNAGGTITSNGAVLDNKLYYISENFIRNKLQQYNPATNSCTMLDSFCNILKWSTLCACDRFLYLCGGQKEDSSVSNQVLKYDPLTNSFEMLAPMQTKRYDAAAIFYQGCLHVLGGHDGSSRLYSVERYDLNTKEWTAFPSMNQSGKCCGLAVVGGRLYTCGESHSNNIEVYDPTTNNWQRVTNSTNTNEPRFDPLIFTHDDKLFVMGGNYEKMVEAYDPNTNQWQIDHQMSSGLQIECPKGGFMWLN